MILVGSRVVLNDFRWFEGGSSFFAWFSAVLGGSRGVLIDFSWF